MSNSQQRGAFEDAQGFDTSALQYSQQQPFDQQQFLSQIQQQQQQQFLQSQQQRQQLNESQFGNQSMISGRFGVPTPAESFRAQNQQNQAQMLNAQLKPGFQTNMLPQFSQVLGNSVPLEREVSQSFNFQQLQQQQQPQQQLLGAPSMLHPQQASILQEILKLQQHQMAPSPMAHTPTVHAQAPQPLQPSYGQGFFNAAQLLASIQQLQQPQNLSQIPQSMNMSISESKTPTIPQTPIQQPNLPPIQQLLNMNTSLNQYQQYIDQIEKQGMAGAQTVSQGNAFSSRPQQVQMQTQQPPYSYLSSTQQSIINQTLGQMQSQLPSQSDMIRQPLKASQQNYPSDDQPIASSMNDTYNRYGLNQSKINMDVRLQQQQEQENSSVYQQVNDGYSFDLGKNTVSKERSYNPQAYTGGYQYGAKPSQQNDDVGFEDGGFSQQRSPKGSVKQLGRKVGEGSPKNSWSSYPNKISAQEPLSYLSNNNPHQRDGRNSPMRQSSGRFPTDGGGLYAHDLDNSFRNNNMNPAAYNQMSNSHNSSSLNHEYQMSSQNNQNYRQQPNERQQYSPAGSNYRFDDNQNDMVNQSLNFGKSQRMPAYQQPQQNNNPNSTNGAINIDDIPIGGGRPKTFEQLLEENLRKMGEDPTPISDNNNNNLLEDDESKPQQKKHFLKRKSQKAPSAVPVKKYGYYVDNFSEEGTKKPRERSFAPGSSQSGLLKNEDIPSTSSNIFKKEDIMEAHITPAARSVSPLNENTNNDKYSEGEKNKSAVKKRFLTRGSGTAGGKQGHGIPKQANKQKKKAANLMSDDDQYPNDFNFAAEQDNKSPKLPHPQGQYPVSRQTAVSRRNLEDQLNRDSITEFEKLEQEVTLNMNNHPVSSNAVLYASKPQEIKKPVSQPSATTNTNKRRKKLFDDSDSDNDEEEEEAEEAHHQKEEEKVQSNESQPQEDQPTKSNVVKKFFYKEDTNKQQKSALQQRDSGDATSAATEHLEKVMRQKMEQLDKTIEAYNLQKESASKLKKEYEQLLNKQRTDFREFEGRKKKEMEDIEKLKVEELEKLKKERKLLEQRQKNLQMVGQSNKREREEIEALKLQLTKVQEESKAKEIKQKSTIDRLQKQVDELKQKNKELQDELSHAGEMLKMTQQQASKQASNQAQHQFQTNVQAASRYTFSSNGGSGNNVNKSVESVQSQQQQNQQQPKGILKNKNEERPESTQMFYQSNNNETTKKHDHEDNDDDDNEQDQDYKENAAAAGSDDDHYKNESSNEKYHNKEEDVGGSAAAEDTEDFDMKFPSQYHNKSTANQRVLEQVVGHDGKVQRVYENGKKEVVFNNGVRREVFPDGYTIVYFNNNDIKQTYPDQKVVYYFAEAKTTQTTFADGLQVFKFANNQIEKHFPDGTKEIIFPDGTIKCIFADGEEESIFPDGTIQRIEKNGVKAIEFANGQKDILFPDGTRIREYPDGRVRKTFPDGTQENTFRQ